MKAIMQAFVDVPQMDPQPLLKFPMDFSLAELRAVLQCVNIIKINFPGAYAQTQNLPHAEESIRMVVHAMQCWNEEHK